MKPRQILAGLLSVLLLLFTGCSRSPSTEGPTSGSAGGEPPSFTGTDVPGSGSGIPGADAGDGEQTSGFGDVTSDEPDPVVPAEPDPAFESLVLPREAVRTLDEHGLTPASYAGLANNGNNGGLSHISTVISPDFSLTVNREEAPVYATLAYIGSDGGYGAVQSFATVFVRTPANCRLEVSLTPLREEIALGQTLILESGYPVECAAEEGSMTAVITSEGKYTFLVNDPEQDHAFVLFVRPDVDDEARIAAYRAQYGDDRVQVFAPGVHEISGLKPESGSVIYLCKGALLVAQPGHSLGDAGVCELRSVSDVVVTGYGTVELSLLEHLEHIALRCYGSSRVRISELTLINGGAWNLYVYYSTECVVSDVTVFGHRMNSDGVNICNSTSVQVTDCWVRTGDDCFSGKTLGGASDAFLMNVVFEGCSAWSGKARCFGVTGEAEKPIVGLTFRDCDILFRDATWDNERLGGLVVIVESNPHNQLLLQDVLFEDIRIHRDTGRAVNVTVLNRELTGMQLGGIVFRNVSCTEAALPFLFRAGNGENHIEVRLETLTVGGVPIDGQWILSDSWAEVERIS